MRLPLLMDLYELTMAAAYHRCGMEEKTAVFDLSYPTNPFGWGCAIFAGLEPALEHLESLRFGQEELDYLASIALFDEAFLGWLGSMRFTGSVVSVPEGEVIAAGEPLLSVRGPFAEVQIVETALLNIINYQTLVATKAARIVRAAGGKPVVEFGARRAPGPDGAMSATRAAFIGGARVTSHLGGGKAFGIPVAGTQAHSFVTAFDSELAAFRAYADTYPDDCVLLVDTYDTLGSGVPNAITVAAELKRSGHALAGIRLDSGDTASLSAQARRMLDAAGLQQVRIFASDELDEVAIVAIRDAGGAVDAWGVGTRLVTAAGAHGGALGGVYKLVELDGKPRIKLSAKKSTIPGGKSLFRVSGAGGQAMMDVIALESERPKAGDVVCELATGVSTTIPEGARVEPLRQEVMIAGRRTREAPALASCADRALGSLSRFAPEILDLRHPAQYPVLLSAALHALREKMKDRHAETGT